MPSALNDAVQDFLSILYGDFDPTKDTKTRNEQIRQRHAAGEALSDLAREYGLTPQRMYQIVHRKRK